MVAMEPTRLTAEKTRTRFTATVATTPSMAGREAAAISSKAAAVTTSWMAVRATTFCAEALTAIRFTVEKELTRLMAAHIRTGSTAITVTTPSMAGREAAAISSKAAAVTTHSMAAPAMIYFVAALTAILCTAAMALTLSTVTRAPMSCMAMQVTIRSTTIVMEKTTCWWAAMATTQPTVAMVTTYWLAETETIT